MQKKANYIVENGKIATLDPKDRLAEAIAISGDKILAVGAAGRINALADANTMRIDAGGRLVTPGLIDAHAHMDREGLKEIPPSLSGCKSIEDILQRIAKLAADTPKGQWIVTMPIGEPPFYFGVPENLAETVSQTGMTWIASHPIIQFIFGQFGDIGEIHCRLSLSPIQWRLKSLVSTATRCRQHPLSK